MNKDELDRLINGPTKVDPSEIKNVVCFLAHCSGDAPNVLRRAKEVLAIILRQSYENWPSINQWRSLLPPWFLEQSSEEITQAEAEERLHLPLEKRIQLSKRWSVSAFVHWFKAGERYWFWWDGFVINHNTIQIEVIAVESPFPYGSLEWLLRASGASVIESN